MINTTTGETVYLFTSQPFILEWCLLSLGLLLAIYTLVYPQIQTILKKNIADIMKLKKEFQEKSKQLSLNNLSKTERKTKTEELNTINDNIDDAYELPYDLYTGFILCISLFSLPLIAYALDYFNITLLGFLNNFLLHIFFGGIILFVILFIMIFSRLNTLAREEFDRKIDTSKTEKNQTKSLQKNKLKQ